MPRGLPPGLRINASTGVISGVPREIGQFGFTVRVQDSNGVIARYEQSLTIRQILVTATLPIGVQSASYSGQVFAANGTPPYAFTLGSALPASLSMDSDGAISGTLANDAATTSFSVSCVDDEGATGVGTFSLQVVAPLQISGGPLVDAEEAGAYSDSLTITGGVPPYTLGTVTGLPAGLSAGITGSTLQITGEPDAGTSDDSPYSLSIEVEDSAEDTDTYSQSFVVTPAVNYVDDYVTPFRVYSLKRLVRGYTGPCIRVIRGSDSAQSDIGFAGDVLDVAALMAFVGTGSGDNARVETVYDQSGNAAHLAAGTADGGQFNTRAVIVAAGGYLGFMDFVTHAFTERYSASFDLTASPDLTVFHRLRRVNGQGTVHPIWDTQYLITGKSGANFMHDPRSDGEIGTPGLRLSASIGLDISSSSGYLASSYPTDGAMKVLTTRFRRGESGAARYTLWIDGSEVTRSGFWDFGSPSGNFNSGELSVNGMQFNLGWRAAFQLISLVFVTSDAAAARADVEPLL